MPTAPRTVCPNPLKSPSPRDRRAWELHAERLSERKIANELGISQSTAHRAVLRVRLWMGRMLPEERGPHRK